MSTTYTAIFQPEAWDSDSYVVPAEPAGPTSWDCTVAVNERPDYFTRLFARSDEPIDADDYLKDDPAAPQWIKSWIGPFTIRVVRRTEDLGDAK